MLSLPLILKTDEEEPAKPEEWMEAMHEQDPDERKRKLDLLMEKSNNKFNASGKNDLGQRIADLLDEYMEGGCFPQ